jgi:hypothetical protein
VLHAGILDAILAIVLCGILIAATNWIERDIGAPIPPHVSILAALSITLFLAIPISLVLSRFAYRWVQIGSADQAT